MNSITCPIPVAPRANAVLAHGSPLRALAWEMLWKSRVHLPALLVLWGVGAWLAHAIASAPPDDPGMISFRQTGVLLWLTSLILGFAPFTLMESHGGWRFSSMTTRWFVLPVPATVLVLLPLTLGWAAIAAVHSAWSPLVQRLLPGTDARYHLVLLLGLMAVVQTISWVTPRKPAQFWTLAAPLMLVALWLAFAPPTSPRWAVQRGEVMRYMAGVALVLVVAAIGVARAHRRGDWPGGFSLALPGRTARRHNGGDAAPLRSPFAALAWTETRPLWRAFALSWLVVATLITIAVIGGMHSYQPERRWFSEVATMAALNYLMLWGLLWLAPAGMVVAGESLGVFKTGFTSFRATLPVNAGGLLAPRLLAMLLAFLTVWVPIVVLLAVSLPDMPPGYPRFPDMLPMLVWFAIIGAHVMIGALPLLLTGRLEGLPTLLVPSLLAWMGTWQLAGYLGGEGESTPAVGVVVALLTVKLLVATTGVVLAVRGGHLRLRSAALATAVWALLALGAIWTVGSHGNHMRALASVTLLPCARLAWCPLAVAFNRHRG